MLIHCDAFSSINSILSSANSQTYFNSYELTGFIFCLLSRKQLSYFNVGLFNNNRLLLLGLCCDK